MSDTDTEFETSSGMKPPDSMGTEVKTMDSGAIVCVLLVVSKGFWGVVDTTQTSSTTTHSTPDQAYDSPRTMVKREKASGIIISALGDAPLRVVMDVDDDPSRMLKLLDSRYASNRTVSRIAVQTQRFQMSYNGQDMSSYIDQ